MSQDWFWESLKHDMCLDEALFTVVPPVVQENHETLKNKLGAVEVELKSTKNRIKVKEPPMQFVSLNEKPSLMNFKFHVVLGREEHTLHASYILL